MSPELEKALVGLLNELTLAARTWREQFPVHIKKPKPLTFTLISERTVPGMPDQLKYNAKFPELTQPDVLNGGKQFFSVHLVTVVDEKEVLTMVFDAGYEPSVKDATFEVPQDSLVEVQLRYFDDSGNPSPVQSQRFTAKDTIAPDAPGVFGEITLLSEKEAPVVPAFLAPKPADPSV